MKRFICILSSYVVLAALLFGSYYLGGDFGIYIVMGITILCTIGGIWFLIQNVGWTFAIFTGEWIIWGLLLFILKLFVCYIIGLFVTPYKIGSAIANIIE